jgi:glucosamine-6-phosphate deaminase
MQTSLTFQPNLFARATYNFRVETVDSPESLSRLTANLIAKELRTNPRAKIALPTGNSPKRTYETLARWFAEGRLSWREAKCFALDEYLDVEYRYSFQNFLETHLYRFTDLPTTSIFNPISSDNYDALISELGGLDFCLLGIGENGHIAFNEPPACLQSWTHCVWLREETKEAGRNYFQGSDFCPERAITMGVSTILASRTVVLIASGEAKRPALRKALYDKPTPDVPASLLTTHKNFCVIADFEI